MSSDLLPESTLTHYLEELRSRMDAITDSLSVQERSGDTARFLATVRDTSDSTIRPAPAAAQRALARTRNPDIGIAQLVQVVEEDPTLGQALLRYANSAYYATGSVTVSLRQAAQRVGVSGIHNVVLGVMLDGMLCRPGGRFEVMLDQVRAHLVRTAPIARTLARAFRLPADECFALALLHDAGKLIVFDVLGTMRHELRRDVAVPDAVVTRVLRDAHEALGALAALHWRLGETTAHPIGTHHRSPVPVAADRMSEVLFLAERADHALARGGAMDVAAWCEQ
ncbi:MAG TPA: HDOD domain-containing protein, partial [Candidatus Elarobacter sp.]|nr:HDOD domain-containing protein [Candidatus Elarobacter sp.]